MKWLAKILKVVGITLLIIILLSIVTVKLVQRPDVQRYLVKHATAWLSNKLHTDVRVGHVDFEFFKKLVLRDIYVADLKNDTLIYAGEVKADISLFSIVTRKLTFSLISASNLKFNLMRYRGQKDYNLQFIFEALRDTSKAVGQKFNIQFKNASLQNVQVRWLDEPNNTELTVKLPKTLLDFNAIDLNKSTYDLNSLLLDSPMVAYKILVPPAGETHHNIEYPIDTSRIFLPGIFAKFRSFKMNGGRFYMDDLTQPVGNKGFDPFHIHLTDITFDMQKVRVRPDSIVADFKQFTAFETHGFTLKRLTGHTRVSAFNIDITNLFIQTDNSILTNYFAMQFRSFHDFEDYVNRIYMKGRFRHAKISMADVSFFAPAIDYMKEIVYLDGDISGTVNRLSASNINLKTGINTSFQGKLTLNGLPDFEETFVNADVDKFTTSEQDARLFYPALTIPENFSNIGVVNYVGSFSGFYNDFYSRGQLSTEHGSIYADLLFKLDAVDKTPGYSAVISTNGLDIGKLTGNPNLGNLDLNGEISGSGFSSKNDSTVFHGVVKSIVFNNYTYKNVALDGRLRKKLFEGQAGVTDDNITLFFKGLIDLNKDEPAYKFTASVTDARLQRLGFYKDDIVFNGDVQVDFTGKSIDDATGSVAIKNLVLTRQANRWQVPNVSLTSTNQGGLRTYILSAPKIASAKISGRFEPSNLTSTIGYILNRHFPALHLPSKNYAANVDLEATLNTFNINDGLNIFIPGIKGFDNSNFYLSLKGVDISSNIFLPNAGYLKNVFNSNYITLNTVGESIKLNTRTSHYRVNNSNLADSLGLKLNGSLNNLSFTIEAAADSFRYHSVVAGQALVNDTNIVARLSNTSFIANNQTWKIDGGNALTISNHNIMADKLELVDGEQRIYIQTDSQDSHRLNFVFNNLQAGDYYNIFRFGGVKAFGIVSGTLSVKDILYKPLALADLKVHNLIVDKDTVGDFSIKSDYDADSERVNIRGAITGKNNDISAVGSVYVAQNKRDIDIIFDVAKVDLRPASDFLKDILSGVKGIANGKLKLTGTTKNLVASGDIVIPTGELTVNYLKTHYYLKNQKIRLIKNAFVVVDNDIFDTYNNKARLSGSINHKNFGSWGADLTMSTDKLLVLNTNEFDNSIFYGKAFASGTVKMSGPFDKMQMDIAMRTENGTVISLPINNDLGVSGYDFVRYVPRDTNLGKQIDSTSGAISGIVINMDLDITPKAEVKMIFNKKSGDIIDGTGSGTIRLEINTAGDFKMYGTYTIDNGNYLFTLPELLTTKHFNIEKGGTVSWSGDPYGAIINLSATYPRKVLLESLVPSESSLTSADATELKQRVPVSVFLSLNGSLFEPQIDFDILIPPEVENTYGIVSRRLQEIKQDKSELNKQVFALMVFNKFLPSSGLNATTSSSSSNYTSGAIESTVGEFFADQLSYWLSQINSKTELNLNYYGTSTPSNTGSDLSNYQAYRQAQVELSRKLFNDRLKVVVGSNIEFGNTSTNSNASSVNNANFAGDFLLEYQLKHNIKLGAYRRTQYDYTSDLNRIRSGGKISYKLEFDKWGDWRKSKDMKLAPAKPATPKSNP